MYILLIFLFFSAWTIPAAANFSAGAKHKALLVE